MDVRSSGAIRVSSVLESTMLIEYSGDAPLGMPSPEALRMASDAMRRHYVLPETMEHPAVRSECLRLAYLIQAYGLASTKPELQDDVTEKQRDGGSQRFAPTPAFPDRRRHSRRLTQDSRTREPIDA
jgi:hypothetical protein